MAVVQNSQHGQSDWDTHQSSTLGGARGIASKTEGNNSSFGLK